MNSRKNYTMQVVILIKSTAKSLSRLALAMSREVYSLGLQHERSRKILRIAREPCPQFNSDPFLSARLVTWMPGFGFDIFPFQNKTTALHLLARGSITDDRNLGGSNSQVTAGCELSVIQVSRTCRPLRLMRIKSHLKSKWGRRETLTQRLEVHFYGS